ncbi:hypothetical protein C8Q73DRAFT_690062 [Cubamyces lactineus]|nr:hypothetical protein C8Q73DRAFT_690062 [Cubamyces lactineus]
MPLASDIQIGAPIVLEDGAVYALRHAQSGNVLCVSACCTPMKDAARSGVAREAQTQKWCASSIGAEWTFQDVETGKFLGVQKREVGARVVTKYDATAWCVVGDEKDSKIFRLVLPTEGYHLGLGAGGYPELVIIQSEGGSSDSSRSNGKEPVYWRFTECSTKPVGSYVANAGTTGWVSSLLSLPSA